MSRIKFAVMQRYCYYPFAKDKQEDHFVMQDDGTRFLFVNRAQAATWLDGYNYQQFIPGQFYKVEDFPESSLYTLKYNEYARPYREIVEIEEL